MYAVSHAVFKITFITTYSFVSTLLWHSMAMKASNKIYTILYKILVKFIFILFIIKFILYYKILLKFIIVALCAKASFYLKNFHKTQNSTLTNDRWNFERMLANLAWRTVAWNTNQSLSTDINFAVNAKLAGFWARPTTYLIQCPPHTHLIISIRLYVSTGSLSKIAWTLARPRINSFGHFRSVFVASINVWINQTVPSCDWNLYFIVRRWIYLEINPQIHHFHFNLRKI